MPFILPVVILLPIVVYLGILGEINRRPRAYLVGGVRDFIPLLTASSGVLFFGVPYLLLRLSETDIWRLAARRISNPFEGRPVFERVILTGTYFLALILIASWSLLGRRRLTSLYNVDAALIESVLGDIIERRQLRFVQQGNVLHLDPATAGGEARIVSVEVETSPLFQHVVLNWEPPDSSIRTLIESDLRRELETRRAPHGRISDALLVAAGAMLFFLEAGLYLALG